MSDRVSGEQLIHAAYQASQKRPDLHPEITTCIQTINAESEQRTGSEQSQTMDAALLRLRDLMAQAGVAWPE